MSIGTEATRVVQLDAGPVAYREAGAGPVVVLVHGLLTNGRLWDAVADRLAGHCRVIVPDWPLGSHTHPMNPPADLSPAGLAALIADFLAALDLTDVTLVGNDTGGALCQLVVTTTPDRVGRLVLTPCDAYDNFLPPMLRPLQWLARSATMTRGMLWSMRFRPLRHGPMSFGWLAKHGLPDELAVDFLRSAQADAGVRRDLLAVLRGISSDATQQAAERFGRFERPVLLAWAPEDRFFPFRHAEAMAAAFPDAQLERIEDSYTFVSIDQPERTADLVAQFVGVPA